MKEMLLAKKAELQKRNKKGFTLMELLIVVTIIAVLVAIAIPMFTAQLEKAREATDEANIRSAYAVISAEALSPSSSAPTSQGKISYGSGVGTAATATITATQTDLTKWETGTTVNIAGYDLAPAATWTIQVENGVVTIKAGS